MILSEQHALAAFARDAAVEVSVVVPCYDRLDLLERTLRACLRQIVPPTLRFEIVVADNHAGQLAKNVVARLAETTHRPLRHVPAPARNIARARNRGVEAAVGRLIGFVDDDEAPEPDWLASHYACLTRTGADASFGPKYPEYEGGQPPLWDPHGWFYTVDFGLPADTEIRPLDWWPIRGRGLGTGNSMLRRESCLVGPRPFDENFGRSGGEDTRLFFGLARAGKRFVWCPSARVREFNVAARLTPEYMRARLQRSARHSAQCRLAVSDHRATTWLTTVAIGAGQFAVHGVLWLATRRMKHWFGISKGLGKMTSGRSLDFVPE
jgi:glycosyltransferase involved in cell wall biosynthesis